MENNRDEFIQKNSPCGGFLQSQQWINFQNKFGIRSLIISDRNFWSNILEYKLPLVGKYFYVPRGPVCEKNINEDELSNVMGDLIKLAKINKAAWIRIDNFDGKIRKTLEKNKNKVVKAPHDMQPKQLFIIDINKSEEDILAKMKPKTRYNIRLASKKGVQIEMVKNLKNNKEKIEKFLDLIEKTGDRKGINFHPRKYYREMFENIDENNLRLYLANYKNKIVAGAIMIVYGEMAVYLHGASNDDDKNVMAPFLLQWQMIKDAKNLGVLKYDFGGVSIGEDDKEREKKWLGVTRFKQGFSKNNRPVEFSGSYDIIINPIKYWTYRLIQKIKSVL
ncbi:MAG: peptidoglycan bridge formation glycyltransferase FemA/FemB family protein [Candidatus Moranbacteria bacterium]|jgi:lipid II:glycine glycyltransferase (peptidoglycan interpeptide bridge formation enzyme)|nr:peptidoglycan bridge formation glycyltransferase FemA/FemB family protein [Candidatus Moranbacteria bacterium]